MTAQVLHRFEPWGVLRDLMHCRADEVLVAGPAGTGKSRACLEKLNLMALLNPGMRGLIVRKTLASLGSTALVTWREHVIPEAIKAGVVAFYGGSPQESPQYRYSNGSVIVIGGMDKSIRIMSSEYDVAYVQEGTELTESDWEAITTRLRNGRISFQQLMADCNPDTPTHWLKVRTDKGLTKVFDSRHEDNPMLFNRDGTKTEVGTNYMRKLDALTGVRYQRLRRGLWVAAEGIVYEDYDPAIHLIDRFEPDPKNEELDQNGIPWSWTRWWVVDFGYTNPFVLQWWAEDPDGRLFMYREIYHTKRTVDVHAAHALEQVSSADPAAPLDLRRRTWREPKPRGIICDHDAEGRAVLAREVGLGTKPANKTKTAGIQVAQKRWRRAGDGRPRMFIMRDSLVERDVELVDAKLPTCTAEEIVGYVWDQSPGKAPKEEPVKENDHGCDCVRYLAAARDLGAPRMRSMG